MMYGNYPSSHLITASEYDLGERPPWWEAELVVYNDVLATKIASCCPESRQWAIDEQ